MIPRFAGFINKGLTFFWFLSSSCAVSGKTKEFFTRLVQLFISGKDYWTGMRTGLTAGRDGRGFSWGIVRFIGFSTPLKNFFERRFI